MRKTYGKLLKALVAVVMIIGILTSGMVRTERVNAASSDADWDAVINIAKKEIGTRETGKNRNKYAQFFDNLRKEGKKYYNYEKNGEQWCAIFVDWCFVQAYGYNFARQMTYKTKGLEGASCTYSYNYYESHPKNPRPGDQIFFKNSKGKITHTGLVVDVKGGRVFTVEGNSENMVQDLDYDLKDSTIYGYGRPDYSIIAQYSCIIRSLYQGAVGTGCSTNDLNKYIAKLGNDKISTTFEPVMWEIYNSTKMKKLSNEEFANRLYTGLIGRSAMDTEITYLANYINYKKDRRAALDMVLDSKEWKDRAKKLGLNL